MPASHLPQSLSKLLTRNFVSLSISTTLLLGAFLFYKNQIAGTIPTEIGNLNKLTWIDCEENQIVGNIPEEFYSNTDLEEVIVKTNSLSGTISSKIGDLRRLNTFWASFNTLTGTIPDTFGSLANLQELELQSNQLTGRIPSQFGQMAQIDFISVENNQLTGPIPTELFGINLAGLRILYLNNNQLSSAIPNNYGSAPRLKDLWLNDNQLTGTLPIIAEGEFLFLGMSYEFQLCNCLCSFLCICSNPSFLLLLPLQIEELLLNNNDITGIVDESVCLIRNNTIPGGQLGVFHADCQPPPGGGEPQIQCSCCTACFV